MAFSIVFIGGFGASSRYAEAMCFELQRLSQKRVFNFQLQHGLTLEEECRVIVAKLKAMDETFPVNSYTIIGFSTGCLVAMRLSEILNAEGVVLINPAELLTRMNLNLLESLIAPADISNSRNVATYAPMLRRSGYSQFSWRLLWLYFGLMFRFALFVFGSRRISEYYFKNFGSRWHEPRPDELQRLIFSPDRRLQDLLITLTECLLMPSLYEMIVRAQRTVHIVEGEADLLYIPYIKVLTETCLNTLFHRTIGDHHMIYHHPVETAQKISFLIKERLTRSEGGCRYV